MTMMTPYGVIGWERVKALCVCVCVTGDSWQWCTTTADVHTKGSLTALVSWDTLTKHHKQLSTLKTNSYINRMSFNISHSDYGGSY